MKWQSRGKKTGKRYKKVSPYEHDWPRWLAITVKIRENNRITLSRTLAFSMPYTDEEESTFEACIIRDNRKTDCFMDRRGYFEVLKTLSSVPFSILQPSKSSLSRDILFIIEIGEPFCPQRARFQWKNPAPETSHCLEYIWTLFGRVIRERNSDIHINDLMRYE